MRRLGMRFWVALAGGVANAALLAATAAWPQWIEQLSGAAPDGGSGEQEWGLAAAFAVASVALLVTAGLDWRRASARA